MAAAIFASLVIKEKQTYGTFFAFLWSSFVFAACLILGTNTLNQIIFGLSLGFWISCTIIFIVDHQSRVTRHF